MTDAGSWVEDWLSAPRFAVYTAAADDDRSRALALYDWNARAAAAFHHDLGHLEVGLRNAYDRALCSRDRQTAPHWVYDRERHFPVVLRNRRVRGRPGTYDANARTREKIEYAVREAGRNGGTHRPAPGKVIVELNFGFWRYLTASRFDHLWRTHLHQAFVRGTRRAAVDARVDRLHDLRNRVAHSEPLVERPLSLLHDDLLVVARLLSRPLHDHIAGRSPVPAVLAERP